MVLSNWKYFLDKIQLSSACLLPNNTLVFVSVSDALSRGRDLVWVRDNIIKFSASSRLCSLIKPQLSYIKENSNKNYPSPTFIQTFQGLLGIFPWILNAKTQWTNWKLQNIGFIWLFFREFLTYPSFYVRVLHLCLKIHEILKHGWNPFTFPGTQIAVDILGR